MIVKRRKLLILTICTFLILIAGFFYSKSDYSMTKEDKVLLKVFEYRPLNEKEVKIYNEIRSRGEPETLNETRMYIMDKVMENIEYKMTHGQEDKITDYELQTVVNMNKPYIEEELGMKLHNKVLRAMAKISLREIYAED